MAGVTRLIHEQFFTSSSSINIVHNCNCRYVGVKLIVNNESRSEYIDNIEISATNPLNELTVELKYTTSGIIQIFIDDIIELGVDPIFNTGGGTSTSVPIEALPIETITSSSTSVLDTVPVGSDKSIKWIIRVEEPFTNSVNTSEVNAHYKNGGDVHYSRFGVIGDKINHALSVQEIAGNIQLNVSNNEPNDIVVHITRILTP